MNGLQIGRSELSSPLGKLPLVVATPRTVWKGSIVVGELAFPIGLAVAHRKQEPALRTLHRIASADACLQPLRQQRVCPAHGEVEAAEVVKAWEVSPESFVVVEEDELAAIAPEPSRSIEIFGFVPAAEIDATRVENSYWISPGEQQIGHSAYALLHATLAETWMAALGLVTAWGSQRLAAIVAGADGVLVLRTLHPAEDLQSHRELAEQVRGVKIGGEERRLALELIDRMSLPMAKAPKTSPQRQRLAALLEAKVAGRAIVQPATAAAGAARPAPTADLADALRRSLNAKTTRRTRAKAPAKA